MDIKGDIIGQHFKYIAQFRQIHFFASYGNYYNNGKEWEVNVWRDSARTLSMTMPVVACQASPWVATALGRWAFPQPPAYLLVNSRMAVALWLEGVLKREHLYCATEIDQLILLPPVAFGETELHVVVKDERKFREKFRLCQAEA